MSARRTMKLLALTLGIGFAVLVTGLAYRIWDSGRVRVHSGEQAVEIAKAAAGPHVSSLPVRIETDQDFWTVRFGPDDKGQVHSYLVTIWDERAGPVTEVTDRA